MNQRDLGQSQRGSVIVITLILLLVMTTMAAGLVYVTGRDSNQVMLSVSRSSTLHSAETCVQDLVRWIEQQAASGPPCRNSSSNQICHSERGKNMDTWKIAGETSIQREKMRRRLYTCDVYLKTKVVSVPGSTEIGTGFDVGQGGTYGGGATRSKYLYQIMANGQGPSDAHTQLEVIASMIF